MTDHLTTSDGLLAARIGQTTYAMIPTTGGAYLAYCYSSTPVEQLVSSDFYGHSGRLDGEAHFRDQMADLARDHEQKSAFNRRQIHTRAYTPWGASQGATWFADGIVCHSTASHGGFELTAERNAQVHRRLRSAQRFYEEDCEWAVVAMTFPDVFTDREHRLADQTLRDWRPDDWEAVTGQILQPGQSRARDEAAFLRDNAQNWIVASAITSSHRPGYVECVARRPCDPDTEARFLTPKDEYDVGRFGFVIDPSRHSTYDGPSDFVGWNARRRS